MGAAKLDDDEPPFAYNCPHVSVTRSESPATNSFLVVVVVCLLAWISDSTKLHVYFRQCIHKYTESDLSRLLVRDFNRYEFGCIHWILPFCYNVVTDAFCCFRVKNLKLTYIDMVCNILNSCYFKKMKILPCHSSPLE